MFTEYQDTTGVDEASVTSSKRVRETCGTYSEHIISTVASAVGLGNLYRFPYICQQNGGGAFIIPYLLTSILVGFPYLLMESIMGQYFEASILTIWQICPLLKGLGFLNFLIVFWTASYYMVLLAWLTYYMCSSISFGELPWERCRHVWNTPNCVSILDEKNYTESSSTVAEYYNIEVLGKSNSIFDIGFPQWYLLIVLAILWTISFLITFHEIKNLGRIITFIMLGPAVTILILLIRSVILPGAIDGLVFLFKPDFRKIILPQVWFQAVSQVFFSYSVGFGIIITYNSNNDYHFNIWRANIIIVVCDTVASLLFAALVYSILGFTSQILDQSLEELTRKGPSLVFLAYPTAVSLLPLSPLWSLFFFMGALILGFKSLMGLVHVMICALEDENDLYVQYRWLTTLVICSVQFLLGMIMTTRAGNYYVDFMDTYGGAGWAVISLVLLEGFVMAYIYGAQTMWENLNDMVGYETSECIKALWLLVSPTVLVVVLLTSLLNLEFLGKQPGFVWWIDYLGILFSFSSIVWVPGYMIYRLIKETGDFQERYQKSTAPHYDRTQRKRLSTEESVTARRLIPFTLFSHSINLP